MPSSFHMDPITKHDLVYSLASCIFSLILYICYGEYVENLQKWQEISSSVVFSVWLVEVVKVLVTVWCFPVGYIFDANSGGSSIASGGKGGRLPFSRRDNDHYSRGHHGQISLHQRFDYTLIRAMDIVRGAFNFLGGVVVGHVMFVLFGAPVFAKWNLTLEFSILLFSSLYFPLALVIHPTNILPEVLYISAWKHSSGSLWIAKWRFLLTLFGAWIGTIVIPLDWDRPWQQWPLPCVVSSFLTSWLVNLALVVIFFVQTFGNARRTSDLMSPKSPTRNKQKCF